MITTEQRSSVRFSGRAYHALALTPESPVSGWLADLDAWLKRSPEFFAGKAIVIDVSKLSLTGPSMASLMAGIASRGIRVLGVEGADPALGGDSLPPLLTAGRPVGAKGASRGSAPQAAERRPAPASSPALLIDAPVRSGQSIVCPEGDVTIIGAVSSGAEVIAAGSIHIYGTLRGRALAGAYGNRGARIFCQRLEAELMAIDGHYLVADELQPRLRKQSIQAWLEGETLQIMPLD